MFLWNVGREVWTYPHRICLQSLREVEKMRHFHRLCGKSDCRASLSAILLGGALSVSGFLLQSFFQNPIAGPYVLGISSGAKLVVALTMIFLLEKGIMISSFGMVMAAFVGSMLAMGFVLLISFSRVKNVAAGGLWDHDRLYLFRHHGLWRHICQRFEYRQSSQLVDGKFFRHDMGKYKNDRRDRRCSSACDFLSGKTDRGISDGGGICQKYWCQCKKY